MNENKVSKNSSSNETSESEFRLSEESEEDFSALDLLLSNIHTNPYNEVTERETGATRHDILENNHSTKLDECMSGKPSIPVTRDNSGNEVGDFAGNIPTDMERVNEIPLQTTYYPIHQGNIDNAQHPTTLLDHLNQSSSPNLQDSYECTLCKKKLVSKSSLIRHMKIHSNERPFECDRCNYTCKRKEDLSKHKITHSNERPFECDSCNYASKTKVDLRKHMKTHSNEKPFQCDRCNFTCKRKFNLKSHMKTHSNERPYECDSCNYASKRRVDLRKHMKIHSNEKPFNCNHCDYTCKWKTNLRSHMKTQHE